MAARWLAFALATLALHVPPRAHAASDFYVGQSGGYGDVSLLFYDASSRALTAYEILPTRVESIDGLALQPGDGAYLSANTLGLGSVLRTDGSAFVPHERSGNLTIPMGLAFGPRDSLYVGGIELPSEDGALGRGVVKRYDAGTGRYLDTFVAPGAGGLAIPAALEFRGDDLFVADWTQGVLRFDASSGAFEGVFVAPDSAGLRGVRYMSFGPSGDLFIPDGSRILRFSGRSGAFLGSFVDGAGSGLSDARGLDFGADGDLYVVDADALRVLRFDGDSGAFVGEVVELGPDAGHPTYLVAVPIPEPATGLAMVAGLLALPLWLQAARRRGDAERLGD